MKHWVCPDTHNGHKMIKKTGLQRLIDYALTKKQIMVIEGNGRPAKSMYIRPVVLMMMPFISIFLGACLMYVYMPPQKHENLQPLLLKLEQQFKEIRSKLSASEAEDAINKAQISSLNSIIQQQQGRIEQLQQKVQVFHSVLEARKGARIQILQAAIHIDTPHALRYHITLVKGGNYPRHISGSLAFSYHDAQGDTHTLQFKGGHPRLPYRMETHTFLQGTMYTTGLTPIPAHPVIELIIYNHKGEELMRKPCTFEISL